MPQNRSIEPAARVESSSPLEMNKRIDPPVVDTDVASYVDASPDSSAFAPKIWKVFVRRPLLFLIPTSFLFLYLQLFVPAFTPIWTGGDAMIWLDDARRMLGGEVLYRDFIQITLPGTDILYFAAFKAFGPRMWIANAMLIAVGIALAWLSYRIAASIDLGRASLLPPVLFLTLVYRDRLDATHHWYSTLAIIAALAVAIDIRSPVRTACAGALCGLATCFTQSAGILALLAFATFLFWEHRTKSSRLRSWIQQEALLFASSAVVVLAVSGYFIWRVGLARFFYCTVVFNARYYGSFVGGSTWRNYMTGLPEFLHWQRIPGVVGFLLVHTLLPLIYVLFLIRYARRSPKEFTERWDGLILINLVGLASFLSVALAPTWARLYYVSVPALLLFIWLLKSEGKPGRFLSNALYAISIILVIVFPIEKQLHRRSYLDLPSGHMAFLNSAASERYGWAASQTRPMDYFFGGLYPDFYFLLNLRNPGPVPFVSPYEYTRPNEVQDVLAGLEKHRVKIVLWTYGLDAPEDPHGDHLGPLRAYVRAHYRHVQDFSDFEVWFRND
jgi:hypothetical protein